MIDAFPTADDPLATIGVPTPLIESASLAELFGVGRIFLKLESERPLGNFKVLGGATAGLRALARAREVGSGCADEFGPPRLICASDGNHGLAVAAAARTASAAATIYLHEGVDPLRAARIEAVGGQIVWVHGNYDDAVEAAALAAAASKGILVPDTSSDPRDPMTLDVMSGYGSLCREIVSQLAAFSDTSLTHLFVQCGVGGLAAAMAEGLAPGMAGPGLLALVEPENAACVGHALRSGRVERIAGDLRTSAEMLSCGLASAPAVEVLRRHRVEDLTVSEQLLHSAAARLRSFVGVETTPSGAAGCAGLLRASDDAELRTRLELNSDSVVLLVVTEGPAD